MSRSRSEFGSRLCAVMGWESSISDADVISLAEKLNTSRATIYAYIAGDREPRLSFIRDLCRLKGVQADYLLGLSDRKSIYADTKISDKTTSAINYVYEIAAGKQSGQYRKAVHDANPESAFLEYYTALWENAVSETATAKHSRKRKSPEPFDPHLKARLYDLMSSKKDLEQLVYSLDKYLTLENYRYIASEAKTVLETEHPSQFSDAFFADLDAEISRNRLSASSMLFTFFDSLRMKIEECVQKTRVENQPAIDVLLANINTVSVEVET